MMKKAIFLLLFISSALFTYAQAVSDKDKKFAEKATLANLMEIKLGELAQTHALSQEVKMLGQHMITDHTKANEDLKALASRKGISTPTSLDDKGMQIYDKMAGKQGKEFDKAYTKCMIKGHKKAIALFKKEEKSGSDDEIRTFASSKLPTLKDHQAMSKDIAKSVKKNSN